MPPPIILVKALKELLVLAINRFNSAEAATLLYGPDLEEGVESRRGGASERSIAHRLAVYLEEAIGRKDWDADVSSLKVDCEYNRHRGQRKYLDVDPDLRDASQIVWRANREVLEDHTGERMRQFYSVFPDIVVHVRGRDDMNLLVVEIKKQSTTAKALAKLDHLKIAGFTKQKDAGGGFGYKLGAIIEVRDLGPRYLRRMLRPEWYINGEPQKRPKPILG